MLGHINSYAKAVITKESLLEIHSSNSNSKKKIAIKINSKDLPPDVNFVMEFDYKKAIELSEKIRFVAERLNYQNLKKLPDVSTWLDDIVRS